MNWKKPVLILLTGAMVLGIVSSCAGDPRKNCNHPQHGSYMREMQKKRTGF
ncbi:MAG: hypothetical protein U0176_25435 [Bacteroidia bacterium]